MHIRSSRVLKKLRNDEVVFSTKINLSDPRVAEIASLCGFDCLWIDMEHVPSDWNTVENHIRAAKVYDVDVMVRVAKGSYSDYVRPLEADAAGIMVPHLMSLAEAKQIVRQTRFHPVGRRPLDGGNLDGKFCMVDIKDYIEESNREKFIVVQIEDPEPMEELDRIAEVEGIDMLFFGPSDFSQGIGAPGDWENERIREASMKIGQLARDNNIYAGAVGNAANLNELVELGYSFINIGADVLGLGEYYKNLLNNAGKTKDKDSKGIYRGK